MDKVGLASATEQIYATRELDGRTSYFAKMEDGRKGEEIVWVYLGKSSDGSTKSAWTTNNSSNGINYVWYKKNDIFEFISIDEYRSINQILS